MDIDRKLMSRAAALLSEAHGIIERVRTKASDYPTEDIPCRIRLAKLSKLSLETATILVSIDELAKED